MLYFLSSIPRSGSTLLASLLGQREDTYVSPTSNLGDTLGAVVQAFEEAPSTKASQCTNEELFRTLKGVCDAKYADRKEEIIFDKGRMWPSPTIMETMRKSLGDVKIVATVRPIAECLASFYEIDKSDLPIKQWIKQSQLFTHLMQSYDYLKEGCEKYPENFCLIEYSELCTNTQRELDRVSDFIGVDRMDFSPVIEQVNENDNAWGIKDLHRLAPTVGANQPLNVREVLGDAIFKQYQGGEFWNDKPEPDRKNEPLDLALECALRGEAEKSYQILTHEATIHPECDRTKYNLGSHEMGRGNLLKGHKLIAHGRNEGVFGNHNFSLPSPLWNGERNCTVLLKQEGGLGDQIHSIRYAKNIAAYGNKVIVVGSSELGVLLKDVEGVTAYAEHEVGGGVYHDFWYPAMSVTIPLELEWTDLSGKPYIERDGESQGKIGLKWSGNPRFEHEQHRLFDPQLMFDATENTMNRISLQKEGDITGPFLKPNLETWQKTRREISKCDLVISSCTSVAHLAGAMGIETYIVTPIMGYYLWEYPGNKTPHYDSVTLFRQEKFGCWETPFNKIKSKLQERNKCRITA